MVMVLVPRIGINPTIQTRYIYKYPENRNKNSFISKEIYLTSIYMNRINFNVVDSC